MVPAAEAEALILSLVHPLDGAEAVETVPLGAAAGRILAQPVTGSLDMPHWDNSAMDGYAVRYADVVQAGANHPVSLALTEIIPAGKPPTQPVAPGQAARILTGSMMPVGADTVVMQEVTQRQGDQVFILEAPQPGQFVRHRGSFYQAGQPLMSAGTALGGPELAVLAAAQCVQVPVFRRLRVAILSTGDELVNPETPLQPGQIVDSNQYALAALVQAAGAEAILLGIVPDQPEALAVAIRSALSRSDVILSSGGVSVGDFDYVDHILTDLGATLHIRAVAVRPGKPLTVATFPATATQPSPTLYFGLPGNPVSALVSFWRFVEPALRKRSGLRENWSPTFVEAVTQSSLKGGGPREIYLWGRLSPNPENPSRYDFTLAGGSHSSGNLVNLAGANALAVVPVGTEILPQGEVVRVMVVR
ncbi:molybdopterin molybdenumtransferase [Leptolyngbya sp. BL0902]|uniref:molybdopterin molybdotransferase MoeA n=1 Tax=Leptolyngbya sp. BL0902 TaxID=1115757 RepID=UPI0018E902BA|nr:gephyrin-like molybdotransferase Glp [Leptolyngbya sp. BL0902]QQE65481.1 molybdopterin molybdenumtransferase [Leptolyngbya sp. BL0902]